MQTKKSYGTIPTALSSPAESALDWAKGSRSRHRNAREI